MSFLTDSQGVVFSSQHLLILQCLHQSPQKFNLHLSISKCQIKVEYNKIKNYCLLQKRCKSDKDKNANTSIFHNDTTGQKSSFVLLNLSKVKISHSHNVLLYISVQLWIKFQKKMKLFLKLMPSVEMGNIIKRKEQGSRALIQYFPSWD